MPKPSPSALDIVEKNSFLFSKKLQKFFKVFLEISLILFSVDKEHLVVYVIATVLEVIGFQ
jgi:hypothetical protein